MDKKKGLIFIDTNVFVIDLRYKKDRNFKTNRVFLDEVSSNGRGITSIFNLLEVCGILSFNLNQQQLRELFYLLPIKYRIKIAPSHRLDHTFPPINIGEVMAIIYKKASFGDALIVHFVKTGLPEGTIFVSWDAVHFKDLLPLEVVTPEEFLAHHVTLHPVE